MTLKLRLRVANAVRGDLFWADLHWTLDLALRKESNSSTRMFIFERTYRTPAAHLGLNKHPGL